MQPFEPETEEKKRPLGFGFEPWLNERHFIVYIPSEKEGNRDNNEDVAEVSVYESWEWKGEWAEEPPDKPPVNKWPKITIEYELWEMVADAVANVFNINIRNIKKHYARAKWKSGQNLVEESLGKHLVFLLWLLKTKDASPNEEAFKVEQIVRAWEIVVTK